MPEDAPKAKQDRARLYGATVRATQRFLETAHSNGRSVTSDAPQVVLSETKPGVNREVTAAAEAERISVVLVRS
jgi:threonine dehydratase